MLRRLPDYDGTEDEDTARVNVPSIHVHMHSEPDHDRESALPELPKKGPWRWIALLVGTIVAAVLSWVSEKLVK